MKKSRRQKRCHCCQRWFTPNPKTAFHQKYCSRQRCQKASKAASQKRWHARPVNRNRWCGPEEVARVREWREKNAGYWRRHWRKKRVRYKK
jgi:hypothetical protein